MTQHQRYAEAYLPRTPWARLTWWAQRRWWEWRGITTPQPSADGRDYTGWRARVTSQHHLGGLPPIGSEGVITRHQRSGAERLHRIEFEDDTGAAILPLPSPHFELIPPAR